MTNETGSATPTAEVPETWPTELRLSADKRTLIVAFDDGRRAELPAEYLRVESPSAEVRGHSPAERKTVPGKRDVAITAVEPVGNYAVRLVFNDGHSTGIYGWRFLAELGRNHSEIWGEYLARLAEQNLSRDPPGHGVTRRPT
jgi:DUF971 family protein